MGSNLPNEKTLAYIRLLPAKSINSLYEYVSKNLPASNGNVVSFNRLITACMGCNTALYPLGNDTQSMSSVFYLGPYLGKGEPSMQQTISIFFVWQKSLILSQLWPMMEKRHLASSAGLLEELLTNLPN